MPMSGLTPAALAVLASCHTPPSVPWSVTLTAGWPSATAFATMSAMELVPSNGLYSEWTCRCTKPAMASVLVKSVRCVGSG